jgi:hypothetical protein
MIGGSIHGWYIEMVVYKGSSSAFFLSTVERRELFVIFGKVE